MSKEKKNKRSEEEIRRPEEKGILSKESYPYDPEEWSDADMVREPFAYGSEKRQGEYTLEDYYAWPGDRRVELIDGVIYVMEAPHFVHQDILAIMYVSLYEYIRNKKEKCFSA